MNENRIVEYKVTAEGQVLGPGFHDGVLTGMQIIVPDLVLAVANYRGELFTLKLLRVSVIAADHFWENNSIADVFLCELEKAPEIVLRRLFSERFPDNSPTDVLRRELHKRGSSRVFRLECAYGVEITAGCNELLITSQSNKS